MVGSGETFTKKTRGRRASQIPSSTSGKRRTDEVNKPQKDGSSVETKQQQQQKKLGFPFRLAMALLQVPPSFRLSL